MEGIANCKLQIALIAILHMQFRGRLKAGKGGESHSLLLCGR